MIAPNPARRAALLSTFSAAVLAACGGGADSPPAPVPTPSAPPTGDSVFDTLVFTRDFTPGVIDGGGNYVGGTETSALVGHRGKLYAAMGFWKDTPGADPSNGAQVLVKDSVGAARRLDLAFNEYALYSTEAMASVEFTTDINGRALNPPVRLLIDGRYEHGRVFDFAHPVPRGTELRATRTIVASPFADDMAGDVAGALYFGGFDAGGDPPAGRVYHNTAWIYRGANT